MNIVLDFSDTFKKELPKDGKFSLSKSDENIPPRESNAAIPFTNNDLLSSLKGFDSTLKDCEIPSELTICLDKILHEVKNYMNDEI